MERREPKPLLLNDLFNLDILEIGGQYSQTSHESHVISTEGCDWSVDQEPFEQLDTVIEEDTYFVAPHIWGWDCTRTKSDKDELSEPYDYILHVQKGTSYRKALSMLHTGLMLHQLQKKLQPRHYYVEFFRVGSIGVNGSQQPSVALALGT